jgi:hypothetical protein
MAGEAQESGSSSRIADYLSLGLPARLAPPSLVDEALICSCRNRGLSLFAFFERRFAPEDYDRRDAPLRGFPNLRAEKQRLGTAHDKPRFSARIACGEHSKP